MPSVTSSSLGKGNESRIWTGCVTYLPIVNTIVNRNECEICVFPDEACSDTGYQVTTIQ